MRPVPEVVRVANDGQVQQLMSKLDSKKMTYYQFLGIQPMEFETPVALNLIVSTMKPDLDRRIDSMVGVSSENKDLLKRAVSMLISYLSNADNRTAYNAELSHQAPAQPLERSSSPPVVLASPLRSPVQKSSRDQRELNVLLGLGDNLEEHKILFSEFLRGDRIPSPDRGGSVNDLSAIRFCSTKADPGFNASELLSEIRDKIKDKKYSFTNVLKQACSLVGVSQDITTPKQQLWVLLKAANKSDDFRNLVDDAKKSLRPSAGSTPSPRF